MLLAWLAQIPGSNSQHQRKQVWRGVSGVEGSRIRSFRVILCSIERLKLAHTLREPVSKEETTTTTKQNPGSMFEPVPLGLLELKMEQGFVRSGAGRQVVQSLFVSEESGVSSTAAQKLPSQAPAGRSELLLSL